MNPPWDRMPDVVSKLEREGPEAILIAPGFTNTAWWGRLICSNAPAWRIPAHHGMFRRYGLDPAPTPAWDVWAFHFSRRPGPDAPVHTAAAKPLPDRVRPRATSSSRNKGRVQGHPFATTPNATLPNASGERRSEPSTTHTRHVGTVGTVVDELAPRLTPNPETHTPLVPPANPPPDVELPRDNP